MNIRARCGRVRLSAAVVVSTLAVGCAQFPKSSNDAHPQRDSAEKQSELVRNYEQRRDDIQYQAALSKAQQGDTPGAKKSLDLLLERSPNHRAAKLLAAEVALELHDPEHAHRLALSLVERDPQDAHAHHTLGHALEALGHTDRAKQHFSEAARIEPKNDVFQASLELANYDVSQVSDLQTKAVAASRSSGRADRSGTATPRAVAAGHQAAVQGNLELAIQQYGRAMAAAPNNPNIPNSIALRLIQLNQPHPAIELLNHACRQFPQSVTLLRTLATAHYRLGDYQGSQVALQQALSLDNADALTYFLLGAVREKLGDQQGSKEAIARAHQLDASLGQRR